MERIAINFAGIPIYWYGVLFAMGIIAGLWTGSKRAALTKNITGEDFLNVAPWIILGAIIGARGLFVITYWNDYFAGQSLFKILDIRSGGLVYFGGFICATISCAIYIIKNKLPFWTFLDITAPSLALGHAFGRIGCFLNGCCYGHTTQCFLGFHYPQWHESYPVAVHPVQLYEVTLNLLLFGFLEYVFRHPKYQGQTAAFYFIGYGIIRFSLEFFRGDVPSLFLGLSQAQLIAITVFIIGIALHFILTKRNTANG